MRLVYAYAYAYAYMRFTTGSAMTHLFFYIVAWFLFSMTAAVQLDYSVTVSRYATSFPVTLSCVSYPA